jgi:ferredoxin
VDLIAADILGIPAKLRWVERAARQLGIAGTDRAEIETAGATPEEVRVAGFRLPHISDVQFGLPGFLKNRLRHHLTSRPVPIPGKCVLCGVCCDACPPDAMKMENNRLAIDYHSCIRCFCCRELCPHAALAVREGFMLKLIKKYL